jgi:hypothetical protein
MLFLVLLPLRKLLNTGFVVKMKWYMSNTAGVLLEAGSTYLSRAPGFTLCVWVRVVHLFTFLCCILLFLCLRLVSCVTNVDSASGLSIRDCTFDFMYIYFRCHHDFLVWRAFIRNQWRLNCRYVLFVCQSVTFKLSLCLVCLPISGV